MDFNNLIISLGQGIGVFVGIVTGILVTLAAQWFTSRSKEKETLRYLKFEIDLNISKISQWQEEIESYRNAVNSDTIDSFSGYFDLSRFATCFYYNTVYSGLLYKYLDFEFVNKLQIIFSEFVTNNYSY